MYPLPWEPNRATFNRQQFSNIENEFDIYYLIPVAFLDWFKHYKQIKQAKNIRLVPYFFLPKIGRRFYSIYMFLSILLHSGLWLYRLKPRKLLASWAYPDAVAASWLSKLFKLDFYFKVHGSDIDIQCLHTARANQVVKASQHAKGILSVSQALAKKMVNLGVELGKIHVIYNGVSHDKFSQQPDRPYPQDYLLFIGNLKLDKGVMELIDGFAKVCKEQPKLHLVYIGSGTMMPILRKRSQELQLTERVTFLGNVDHNDIPKWLNHSTALCLPSYHEGVPNVILEAMASATPIIATSVGGIPEVLDKNVCGLIIPPKDSSAISNAIIKVCQTTWDKEAIKNHSVKFSWERNKQQLIHFLSK